jgi:hypothetical protein
MIPSQNQMKFPFRITHMLKAIVSNIEKLSINLMNHVAQKNAIMSWYTLSKLLPLPPLILILTAAAFSASYPSHSKRMG